VFKLLLLFSHLLGTSLALGAIVATDIRLLAKLADNRVRISPPNPYVMRLIALALLILYVTGTSLVLLNLAHDADPLGDPKLQAKLILVAILSLNALVLHRISFPALARGRRVARWKSIDFFKVAVPVALSNCLWMYCAFLGIARPWNRQVTVDFVLGLAAALFAVTLAVVWTLLLIAAQDRGTGKRGWIDRLKRRIGVMANAMRV
jgi:hypothetical protein